MRIKFLSVILSFLLMSIAISSCLDSDDNYEYSSDATIRAFGIDSIGKGIYYKFTIDQLRREIYNVDSLPVWADTDSLIDRILIDTLTVTGWVTSGINDTVFNMNDSISLREPIKLKVHAADGVTTREYTIKVNVHKQDPDSLIWKEMTRLPVAGKQKSVILNEDLIVYTSTTTAYRSSISNPRSLQWSKIDIKFPEDAADAKLNSIVNFNNKLFITTESGKALYSEDGINWHNMDVQGMQMVTFIASVPGDDVTGSKPTLAGIFTEKGENRFCARNAEETTWKKGEKAIPSDFPLEDIYSTVFTNASGIKQVAIVGNTNVEVKATVPWFTMDGLSWADMSTESEYFCPSMKNPSIMYYGGLFHAMGGDFKIIYSSRVGIAWNEAMTKFRYPTETIITPGEDEDDEETIEYKSLFEGKGDYSLTIDKDHYIWIVWNKDGSVWRGRQNKLGFAIQ